MHARLLSFLLAITLLVTPAQAQEQSSNFSISLHSTYTITANGKTIVEQKITIKNKSPELFVSKYGIVLSSTNISSIETTSNGKSIEHASSKQKGQTSIGVSFAEPVVGEGKSNELIIRYTDSDLALISGKVLEINIPKLADEAHYDRYQLELRVPELFGHPTRISPSTFTLTQDGDYNVLTFHDSTTQAVSAIFGNKQVFDLRLNYYLNNPTSQNALTQITLPPETPLQKVNYRNLEPMPASVKEDQDGNFIATYEIPANNSYNVELLAQILLTLSTDSLVPTTPVLPEHLDEQKFWESTAPVITEANQNLNSIKSIYDFTVNELNYTKKPLTQNFTRLGAVATLAESNKNDATCQEFTDLFITLARAKQIPARRMIGVAYTNNEELRPSNLNADILHTWPEYYNHELNSWTAVDPTWEDTTGGIDYFNHFDLNHIVLAINGVSSTLPYPAGTYSGKQDEQNKKISLELSKEDFVGATPNFAINLIEKKFYGLAITGAYTLQILNQTGQTWYFENISIEGDQLEFSVTQENAFELKKILPFAKIAIPLTIYNTNSKISQNKQARIRILLKEGQVHDQQFEIRSRAKFASNDQRKIAVLGGGFIILTLLAGSLLIFGRRFAHSLRGQSQKFEKANQQLSTDDSSLKKNSKNDSSRQSRGVSDSR